MLNYVLFAAICLAAACSAPTGEPLADARNVGLPAEGSAPDPYAEEAWAPVPVQDADALAAQLDSVIRNLNLVGAAMGVAYANDHMLWTGASGLSSVERTERWTPERSFRIGSVTKTFTAALIFLLEADGALTLDDALEQWVPGYYDGVGVTIRHMLSHTSGIVSYNYVGSFDDSRVWTPQQLVRWAVDQEPTLRFAPGTQWEHSNTNYVLLGLVVEAASWAAYEDMVEERLTGPLGLRDTYISTSGDANPAIVDCYDADKITNWRAKSDPSFGWAAGAGVSTPADLARWAVALYGGEVLPPEALARMVAPSVLADSTTLETGLGAFVELDGEDALYGHSGGFAGYMTYMYCYKLKGIAVVAMSNTYRTNLREFAPYGWSVPLGFEHP